MIVAVENYVRIYISQFLESMMMFKVNIDLLPITVLDFTFIMGTALVFPHLLIIV